MSVYYTSEAVYLSTNCRLASNDGDVTDADGVEKRMYVQEIIVVGDSTYDRVTQWPLLQLCRENAAYILWNLCNDCLLPMTLDMIKCYCYF